MLILWGIFLPAAVLLLYPAERIFPENLKLRTYGQLSDPALSRRKYWWRWQPVLWADALRIGAAIWLLQFSMITEADGAGTKARMILGAMLGTGLVTQLLTRRKADAMFAPLGYVLATLYVLLPPAAAVPVTVLGIVAMMALREFTAFFFTGAVASIVIGYFLGGSIVSACLVAAIFVLPAIISTMFGCKLVLPVRSRSENIPLEPPR